MATPTAYSMLYIIASSGDGTASSLGSGTNNFADGSTQDFSYNSFDWCNSQGGLHPEAVLPGPHGRADIGPDGKAFDRARSNGSLNGDATHSIRTHVPTN